MNQGVHPSHEAATFWRFRRQAFMANGSFTWNRPPGVRGVRVEVYGGGGNGDTTPAAGGFGGAVAAFIPNVPAQVQVTVGTVASASSFGAFVTCTGGANAAGSPGANGTATVAGGAIREGEPSLPYNGPRPAYITAIIPGNAGNGNATNPGGGAIGAVIVEWMEPYAP